MSGKSHIELQYSSILNVPFDKYDNFYFIINETNYQTTRIVADILSPHVINLHSTDTTIKSPIYKIKKRKVDKCILI